MELPSRGRLTKRWEELLLLLLRSLLSLLGFLSFLSSHVLSPLESAYAVQTLTSDDPGSALASEKQPLDAILGRLFEPDSVIRQYAE